MAVVRDYLITQFTIYGATVLANQFARVGNTIEKLLKPLESLGARRLTANFQREFAEIAEKVRSVNNFIQQNAQIITNLGPKGQKSVERINKAIEKYIKDVELAGKYLQKGQFEKFERKLAHISANFSKISKELETIKKIPGANIPTAQLENLQKGLQDATASMATFFDRFFDRANNRLILRIRNFVSVIKRLAVPAILGLGTAAIFTFASVSRAIYNVTENIREAYRLTVDLGTSLPAGFALARGLEMFGFDIGAITDAVQKLSDAITKNKLGSRLMVGWLGISPFELQQLTPLEAIDKILDKIMQLPSVSLRRSIGKELLGERFSDLLMLKETGMLEEIKNIQTVYSKDFLMMSIKASIEWAKLKMHVQDIGIHLVNYILPGLNAIANAIGFIVKNSKILFSITLVLGIMFLGLRKYTAGVGLTIVSLLGLYQAFTQNTENLLTNINDELRQQTTILSLQYRTINTIKMQLNEFLATTARNVPNLYQASVYRALLTNTGGI